MTPEDARRQERETTQHRITERTRQARVAAQTELFRHRLHTLEDRLAALWPDSITGLTPGLTPEEFDTIWAANDPGFPAPYEIRVWYEWHADTGSGHTPWFGHEGLEDVLDLRTAWVEVEAEIFDAPKRRPTMPDWLPLFGEPALLHIVDCSAGPDLPCPIYLMSNQDDFYPAPQASSLATLVDAWHYALDVGAWAPPANPSPTTDWIRDRERLPTSIRNCGLPGI